VQLPIGACLPRPLPHRARTRTRSHAASARPGQGKLGWIFGPVPLSTTRGPDTGGHRRPCATGPGRLISSPPSRAGPVPAVPTPESPWRRTRSALRVHVSNRRPYDCRGHHQSGYPPTSMEASKPRWCATLNGGARHVHAYRRRLRRPRAGRWNRTPRPSAAPGTLGLRASCRRLSSTRQGPRVRLLLRGFPGGRFTFKSAPSWRRTSAPDRKHVVRYACGTRCSPIAWRCHAVNPDRPEGRSSTQEQRP
jgi:hypothetical protein